MALTTGYNGQEITAPDTNSNTFELHQKVQKPSPTCKWKITVTSGTIKFSADHDDANAMKAWPVNSVIEMTVKKTLYYKAASNTDKFVVTV